MQVPIQLVMTVDPDRWAQVSGIPPERIAGNVADYLEREIRWLPLVVNADASVVAKAADVAPPPTHKAQGVEGFGQ